MGGLGTNLPTQPVVRERQNAAASVLGILGIFLSDQ